MQLGVQLSTISLAFISRVQSLRYGCKYQGLTYLEVAVVTEVMGWVEVRVVGEEHPQLQILNQSNKSEVLPKMNSTPKTPAKLYKSFA